MLSIAGGEEQLMVHRERLVSVLIVPGSVDIDVFERVKVDEVAFGCERRKERNVRHHEVVLSADADIFADEVVDVLFLVRNDGDTVIIEYIGVSLGHGGVERIAVKFAAGSEVIRLVGAVVVAFDEHVEFRVLFAENGHGIDFFVGRNVIAVFTAPLVVGRGIAGLVAGVGTFAAGGFGGGNRGAGIGFRF